MYRTPSFTCRPPTGQCALQLWNTHKHTGIIETMQIMYTILQVEEKIIVRSNHSLLVKQDCEQTNKVKHRRLKTLHSFFMHMKTYKSADSTQEKQLMPQAL